MENKVIISPSLLSADFSRLAQELEALEKAEVKWAHLDVMDGRFVPNITFGPPVIKSMRKNSKLFFDTHLMIKEPERYIDEFAQAGADLICIHAEATNHLERAISQISDAGIKSAVALNPATPLESIRYLLPQLDMVLIMSVNPGFGGQKFIPFCLDKIRELKAMLKEQGSKALIQVDGGVTLENCAQIVEAGADVLVSGSAFFNTPSYAERHRKFLEACTL